jgi:transposase
LQAENDRLRHQLDAALRAGKRQAGPFATGWPKPNPRKPGRKPGKDYGTKAHRQPPRPEQIDEVHEAPLPHVCPDCGGLLDETHIAQQYQVEIPRQPIHRQFNVHIGQCRACRRRVQGRHPLQTSDALGAAASQLGPDAQAAVVELNKQAGLSHGKVTRCLKSLFGIDFSRGGSVHTVLRAASRCEPVYEAIRLAVGQTPLGGARRDWLAGGRIPRDDIVLKETDAPPVPNPPHALLPPDLDRTKPPGSRATAAGLPLTPVRVWDTRTGQERLALRGFTRGVGSATFSPDGKRLLTVTDGMRRWCTIDAKGEFRGTEGTNMGGRPDPAVRVWDAESGQLLATLGDRGFGAIAAWCPDGSRIVTDDRGGVQMWDALNGKKLFPFEKQFPSEWGLNWVQDLVVSPDGRHVLGLRGQDADLGAIMPLWDAGTGKLRSLLSRHQGGVTAAAFSPDSRWVATASKDGTARVWDADTGRERLVLRGHEGAVRGVAFSPDGKRIATVADDATARLWDAATGRAWLTLTGHGGPVHAAVFSPDGERLATTSEDGTVRVWPVDPLPEARARRPRELTPAERQRFTTGASTPSVPPAAAPLPSSGTGGGVWNQDLADCSARDARDKPTDLGAWSRAALVGRAAGDRAGDRRLCATIRDTFLRSRDANQVSSAAWACVLGPDAVADFEPVLHALERAIGPKPDAGQLDTLGAVLYRPGRFEDAVKRLEEAVARRDKVGTAPDWLFLAMAHQRLGHADEARPWLKKGLDQDVSGLWGPGLELPVLCHEADKVVNP